MDIDIIGASCNLGANKLGVEIAPLTILKKLNIHDIFLRHNLQLKEDIIYPSIEQVKSDNSLMKNKAEILLYNKRLADSVYDSLEHDHFPLTIGGDHVISWGSISGVTKHSTDVGCIYIDAHGDFNPAEVSPSHNVHGMHMCYLMGLTDSELNDYYYPGIKLDKHNVFFVGTRSLDSGEKALIKRYDLNLQTSEEIKKYGIEFVTDELLKQMETTNLSNFHISFDIDSIDPEIAPGTGVPEKDGITPEDVMYLFEKLFATHKIISMDFVEFNPLLDINNKTLVICENLLIQVVKNLNNK